MDAAAFYGAAMAAGISGGWAFAAIWRRLAPMSLQGLFWSNMANLTRGMLTAEETHEFLELYRRLGGSVLHYVCRNVGGLVLGCLPIIVLAFVLSGLLFGPWDSKADGPGVYPPGSATLQSQRLDGQLLLNIGYAAEPIPIERRDPVRAAVCWSMFQCLLLQSLDFSVTALDAPIAAAPGAVIVRPDNASWNPLFPYLNDLEFTFSCMTLVGVAGAFLVRRKRK